MAQDSDLERTEAPTPRKLEEARNKGQVPRSQELGTAAVLLTGFAAIFLLGDSLLYNLKAVYANNLHFDRALLEDNEQLRLHFFQASLDILRAFTPFFLATAAAAFLSSLLLSGWIFSWEPLAPKFSKLNPLTGLSRITSVTGLSNLVKTVLKSALIGGVSALTLWWKRDELTQLIAMSPFESLAEAWRLLRMVLFAALGAMLLIALIDVPFQIWNFRRGLRMTKQEVRDELRQAEGDPQIRARVRQLQRDVARKRMMNELPRANVVITNPTHYAVALRYDEKTMSAPQVVAKGSYLLAQRIIEVGREHRIPVFRIPRLARALYHHAELGREVPSALYTAVAEVLAYLYQLNHWQHYGGREPNFPSAVDVPVELDPGYDAPE